MLRLKLISFESNEIKLFVSVVYINFEFLINDDFLLMLLVFLKYGNVHYLTQFQLQNN